MKKFIYIILILALIGFIYYETAPKEEAVVKTPSDTLISEYATYKSSEYSPEFTYPTSWGAVILKEGNNACPEEDTYRTSDTLHVFDWEFGFNQITLPGSESMIRKGIRTYELDPKKLNDCGDDFHLKIAKKEVDPETISSFMLNKATNASGLTGTYNRNASRLNTEYRSQYTFYVPQANGTIYVIQPYISFIPFFDSPELKEMEGEFKGDMLAYIEKGNTSANIRGHLAEFIKMSESLKFSGE